MTKKVMIEKIDAIISEYGIFTTAEIGAEASPCINSMGGVVQLAERFDGSGVTAITYETRYDNEIGEEDIPYEDLSGEVLKEILVLAREWKRMENEWC